MQREFRVKLNGDQLRTDASASFTLPLDTQEVWGKAKVPVKVTINGYTWRSTVGNRGGIQYVVVNADARRNAGVKAGDVVTITLEPDTEKRDIEIPIRLRRALSAKLTEKLNRLSFTHTKEFVVWYSEAKKEEHTRSASGEDEADALVREGYQLRNRHDNAPRFRRTLDQLMGARYLIRGDNLGDVKPPPSRLKCLINSASGFNLCLGWHIVAADKEDSGVHKDELPEWNFRRRRVGGIGRYGTALRQYRSIGIDVRGERHFNYVMNSVGSHCPDSLHQVLTIQHNLVRSCTRSYFLVAFGAESGDDSRSRSMA
jgi:Domain of unknown function (DUF1905)